LQVLGWLNMIKFTNSNREISISQFVWDKNAGRYFLH